ncbi:hypothetical protein CCR75_004451 [Bremia lactucae]|uniref:Chromo domain-containing protein n=1 Tax=Bremia lactucae TaxID=4779 RepID=A0A976III1_BRELC|nr:hypothetical protein CCR75_004451 [Bremia lactucae]
MVQDNPVRSKQMELFGKLHVSMDHVLGKLLMAAPPLPDKLKLQTETQSLAATWVQVSEAFEKRKAMLERRKQKAEGKKESFKEASSTHKNKNPIKKDSSRKQMSKSHGSATSPRTTKSPRSVKADKKASKKVIGSPSTISDQTKVNLHGELSSYDKFVLQKLHKLPMCQDVKFGTNKYRAIVKWMELDKGKDTSTSASLMKLLTKLQSDTQRSGEASRQSHKRSLESLNDTLHAETLRQQKSSKTTLRPKKQKMGVNEVKIVDEEDESKKDSESSEAEFIPELRNSPPHKKVRGRDSTMKKQQVAHEKKETKTANESAGTSQPTSRDHLAVVVAKIRADKVASQKSDTNIPPEVKFKSGALSKIKADASLKAEHGTFEDHGSGASSKLEAIIPGASSTSAIVVDESDEEEVDEEDEYEDEDEAGKVSNSSTDDDQDLFDLNEEDVYVVEAILCVKEGRSLMTAGRRQKEADLYLVKWDGYNELTWEPDENIPRRLIEMFRERERAKRACQYQIKVAHERREVINVTTQQPDVIYMIQWINQKAPVWESRTTLPVKTQVWLDKVLGASKTKKRR